MAPVATDSMELAEAQWMTQMKAIRDTIAELKLSQVANNPPYGKDIDFDDKISSDTTSDGDIWDLIASDEDEISSTATPELIADAVPGETYHEQQYSHEWLASACARAANAKAGLNSADLLEQVSAALSSDSNEDELQMFLVDMLGFEELDLVTELLAHRVQLTKSLRAPLSSQTDGLLAGLQTKEQRMDSLRRQDLEHKSKPLAEAIQRGAAQYPHVYKKNDTGNTLDAHGRRYGLPVGSERKEHDKYEEYSIPATKTGSLMPGQKLVNISSLDGLCRQTFRGYKTLNRMQSLLYEVAYHTSENMLVCAPTGAGKTDAAMLTILNTIAKNITPSPLDEPEASDFAVRTDDFKIVYVAPMKALAAEITEKFSKRLAWLGIQVRELTGDMHLTKQEILATQIIVTTPEKWDVVTRKSTGDTELVQKVRLLIIDEVHMLHDERGAVLESLVARTQRQVESTQSLIRIVGLSATLPNYLDVADFLKVNRMAGLFYFDQSFRPVPLEQHFVGVKGKSGSRQSRDNLDQVTFEKIRDMLQRGHQCMVFVHSRKDTYKAAMDLYERAQKDMCMDLFDPSGHDNYDQAVRDMKNSRGRELRELLPKGMGTHHAGMARSDRNLTERLFSDGVLKVLCCTATLAWGVNLPAAAVVIKGTQLYSAEEGKFVDLGILDVLQIFGRAGRPQFQDTGIGFICTVQDKLQHYLTAVTQQQPIESRFSKKLVDNLNAEISLGTVTSVSEAVTWVGYSYLFVRMQRNPSSYGIEWSEIQNDPQLVERRRTLIIQAAKVLQDSQMIIFNETTEELRPKDVGRIASQFYVLQTSIQIFNTMMRPRAGEADALKMISMSGEFDNVQSRDSESKELQRLKDDFCQCEVREGIDTPQAKTNILLQSYISRAKVEDFALVSDSNYVAQNAARICRALFMTALNRKWGYQCLVLSSLCKSIDKQIWAFQHPLHQFDLPQPVLRQLDANSAVATIEDLKEMEPSEIGDLVHNKKMGSVIAKLMSNFPTLTVEAEIAPLNRDVLRVRLFLTPEFRWNDRHHGTSESYWVWVENAETSEIYHHELFILSRKKLYDDHELSFTIPLSDPIPSQIYVRAVSDRWLGAETVTAVSFQHLIRPDTESVYTDLLDLQPLPISALKNPVLEEIYGQRFQYFNPMQTQLFHCMYHTPANVLLGSPTGSGKTVAAELAMWWAFRERPGSKVVYIAPMKALVRERVQDWRKRLAIPMGIKLVELTGDNTPDTRTIRDADIIITTPEKWDGISRSWQTRSYVRQVSLVIIDEIHLLGGDRGPILEIIVSRMNYIASQKKGSVRLVGMSTACANAMDLGNWLGVKEGLFNFRHSVRPVPLEIYIDGFPEQRGFCPFMQSMNRPTFLAIKSHSPDKPVIVFVASRRQTRLTARDLINFCGMEDNPRRFVKMSEDDLELNLARVKDDALREAMSFGIGLHHAGLVESDRQLAEELFANNKIQILVATSTLAWGVNLPAHLVVVKGTQFFDAKIEGYKDMDLTDVLQMLGRAGRPQFDTSGIARIFTQDSKKEFYKHFLHTGFPVESSLHNVLDNHLGAEISASTIATKQDALDYLTWTFFFRRIHKNPSCYGLEIDPEEQTSMSAQAKANEYLIELVDKSLGDLEESSCVQIHSNGDVDPTPFGKIMSYYYLSHKTIRHLLAHAKEDASFEDVLAWMSCATEYDELPVRHNEDLINAELSKNLPVDASKVLEHLPMWDPHVKAFLLLQAHFSRIDLPISDYVGDKNSVLDQAIRIIQASIDVLAELGHVKSCVQMIKLLQCVKSAHWPEDLPMSVFPGVDDTTVETASAVQKTSLTAITLTGGFPSPASLTPISKSLNVPLSRKDAFVKAVSALPNLAMEVKNTTAQQFDLEIRRVNPPTSPDHRMYAPRYPKPQTEGFFAVVTDASNGSLIAIKRMGWPTGEQRQRQQRQQQQAGGSARCVAKNTIRLPPHTEQMSLNISILSDGYIGMEWQVRGGVKVPAPPVLPPEPATMVVQGQDGKKEKIEDN
ncbi:hypothetical protein FH972_022250 [Carpinus fangiana]|uniref:RNA helicase n=1 Tax=Carpinus fangiana TaxID=176857 RepID=A0A5N6KS22_9ROSI|nr:hypothetical protein FH972_022250 [Carpinus fangiana]